MALPLLLAAVRDLLAGVEGVKSAYYPAPNVLNAAALPAVIVYSGSPEGISTISDDTQRRLWLPAFSLQLFGPRVGNTPPEFARIDALIEPIVDAFDTKPAGQLLAVPGLHVDRIKVTGYRASMLLGFGDQQYAGAEFYLSTKYHRRTGQ